MRCLTICCWTLCIPLTLQAQELPADLAQVPGKAVGFVHMQTADVWKSPFFKMYRDILPKAGSEALDILEKRLVPPLSSIDRITVVILPPKPGQQEPDFGVLLHLNKPLDQQRFVAGLEQAVDGVVRYYALRGDATMQILGENVIMIGSLGAPAAFAEQSEVSASFRDALRAAATGDKAIVGALNPSIIPPQALAGLPPMVQPFARAKTLMLALDLGKTVTLDVDFGFANADEAKEAEQALHQVRELGKAFIIKTREEMKAKLRRNDAVVPLWDIEKVAEVAGPVFALAMMKRGEELLDGIPVARNQQHVSVKVAAPEELSGYMTSGPVMVALLLPAIQKVREASARTRDANNLKQLALAMHISHDIYRHLPPPAICDKNGKPLLSWRVAILPFIEQQPLFRQFKLDEPWDSEHNKRLLDKMPSLYQMSGAPVSKTHTHYRVLVGPDAAKSALFKTYCEKASFLNVRDGTSNTLMIVEAQDSVPWTKPDELIYNPNGPLPAFNRLRPGFNIALCDGSVRFLANTIPEATLRALITRAGNETFNID